MSLNTIVWKRIQQAFDEVPSSKGMSYRDHALENLHKALVLILLSSGVAVHALFPMVCGSCESAICRTIGARFPVTAPWYGPSSQAENTLAAAKAKETCAAAVQECKTTLDQDHTEADGSEQGAEDVFEPEPAVGESKASGDDSVLAERETIADADVRAGAGNVDVKDIERPTNEQNENGFEEHNQ